MVRGLHVGLDELKPMKTKLIALTFTLLLLASCKSVAATATLSWDPNPSTDGVISYNVYQATGSGAFARIGATSGAGTPVFQANNLTNGVAYRWQVTAVNSAGEGAASNIASLTVNALPKDPTNLGAVTMSASRIDLRWQDASDNETGFVVQRSLGTGPYASIATVAANSTSFINVGLLPRKNYCYRVFAINDFGLSQGYAGPACERTLNH